MSIDVFLFLLVYSLLTMSTPFATPSPVSKTTDTTVTWSGLDRDSSSFVPIRACNPWFDRKHYRAGHTQPYHLERGQWCPFLRALAGCLFMGGLDGLHLRWRRHGIGPKWRSSEGIVRSGHREEAGIRRRLLPVRNIDPGYYYDECHCVCCYVFEAGSMLRLVTYPVLLHTGQSKKFLTRR